mgnify:CR=1 FL=1
MEHPPSFRKFWYQQTFVKAKLDSGLSLLNRCVLLLVILGMTISVLDTEPALRTQYGRWFRGLELTLACIFAAEYTLRLWAISEDPRYRGIGGRIGYALTPLALIDLVAFLPSLLTLGLTDSLLLRIARVMRFVRFAKIGQYSQSIQLIGRAFKRCWRELVVSYLVATILILVSASALYLIESDLQPESFGSIPRALWWSLATLTTIGYGDVYPITVLGKMMTGLIALTGIGLVGLPTAILAGAFSDEYEAVRRPQGN